MVFACRSFLDNLRKIHPFLMPLMCVTECELTSGGRVIEGCILLETLYITRVKTCKSESLNTSYQGICVTAGKIHDKIFCCCEVTA